MRKQEAEAEEVKAGREGIGFESPVSVPMDRSRSIHVSPQGLSTVCPAYHALHCPSLLYLSLITVKLGHD
jgi:hypothetical protein